MTCMIWWGLIVVGLGCWLLVCAIILASLCLAARADRLDEWLCGVDGGDREDYYTIWRCDG